MKKPTTCKVCRKPIVLEICDRYFGDPYKLIRLATCNRCFDSKTRRDSLEDSIRRVAVMLATHRNPTPKVRESFRAPLERLARKYSQFVAETLGSVTAFWEPEIVELLLDKPSHWQKVLRQIWTCYEDRKPAPVTVYADDE